jgi:hypothetical protein
VGAKNDGKGARLAIHRADERQRWCGQISGEGWPSKGGGGREGNGGGERGDGLLWGPLVRAEKEKGGRAPAARFRSERRERMGGSGYSGAGWRRGEGGSGHGWRVVVAGPTAAGAGGCRREGERGDGDVAGVWAGSGVWGPAVGRE